MNTTLKRGLSLVAVYILVLVASVLTGMVYTGQTDISLWTQDMRNTIAGAPFGIVLFMVIFGIV
jgi:uncharacterized membrane protein